MDQIRSAEERNLQMKKDVIVDLSLVMGMDGRETSQMTVQKLSEELMAFENYMKFYQIPYLDGQSAAAPPIPAQESVIGELWTFDDDDEERNSAGVTTVTPTAL
ncbi:hypothetical protein NL676_007597 [Syzygium grande]|nr:hypothetical protein NL676_007597 [Syzygium grande]